MAITQDTISKWFDYGVERKKSHLIVVCDTWDYEDYAVYVDYGKDPRTVYAEYNGPNMQKVMEVYNLTKPKAEQLNMFRCFDFDIQYQMEAKS